MALDIDKANDGVRAHSRGAVTAVITVNGGAMVALISQLAALREFLDIQGLKYAFACWIAGVTSGLLCWLFITLAGGMHANGYRKRESAMTWCGYVAWIIATGAFVVGAGNILSSLN